MKVICELNDKIILGTDGLSTKAPRITARAIVQNEAGLYAVMYSEKFKLHIKDFIPWLRYCSTCNLKEQP